MNLWIGISQDNIKDQYKWSSVCLQICANVYHWRKTTIQPILKGDGSKGGDDLPYPSHLMSSPIASWHETQGTVQYSANENNPISAQAQPPNAPISVPVFYGASWLHSGVQPLPSANHLQLRNNGLITETVTHPNKLWHVKLQNTLWKHKYVLTCIKT